MRVESGDEVAGLSVTSSFYIFRRKTRSVKRISVIIYHFGLPKCFKIYYIKIISLLLLRVHEKRSRRKFFATLSQLSTFNSQLSTLNFQLSTLNSQLSTLNSQLSTLNSQHLTLNTQHLTLPVFPHNKLHRNLKAVETLKLFLVLL